MLHHPAAHMFTLMRCQQNSHHQCQWRSDPIVLSTTIDAVAVTVAATATAAAGAATFPKASTTHVFHNPCPGWRKSV
jgi:hypothetical protein